MGVVRWLSRIEPDAWDLACRLVADASLDLIEVSAATEFLMQFDKRLTDELLLSIESAEDNQSRAAVLSQLFEVAVTDNEWYMDKALDNLADVVGLLPETMPILKIIDFSGLDRELPKNCQVDDGGLLGCCSLESMRACLDVVNRYPEPQVLIDALRSAPQTFVKRLTGRARSCENAAILMSDDYYAESWRSLVEAVRSTTGEGKLLGLGISI